MKYADLDRISSIRSENKLIGATGVLFGTAHLCLELVQEGLNYTESRIVSGLSKGSIDSQEHMFYRRVVSEAKVSRFASTIKNNLSNLKKK